MQITVSTSLHWETRHRAWCFQERSATERSSRVFQGLSAQRDESRSISGNQEEEREWPWCPTLCVPIDGSPPGFPVPEILRARTLEWVAISFSTA